MVRLSSYPSTIRAESIFAWTSTGATVREAGSSAKTFTLLIALAPKVLRLAYLTCLLCAFQTIVYCAPYVPAVLRRAALLGTVLCLVFELVLRVPGFPFWNAMVLPAGCAGLLVVHRALSVDE